MISGITIENFKGIRERISLDLRPITLLFGANSAGKSTITDALDFFEAVLTARSPSLSDLSTLEAGANAKENSFERLIHNHDSTRTMTIGVKCELSEDDDDFMSVKGMPSTQDPDEWETPSSLSLNYADEFRTLQIELKIKGQMAHFDGGLVNSAHFQRLEIRYNDEALVVITPLPGTSGRLKYYRWKANLSNPLIPEDLEQSGEIEFNNYHFELIPRDYDPPLLGGLYQAESDGQAIPNAAMANYLNSLVLGAFNILGNRLRQRRTIGGIREVPTRNSIPLPSHTAKRWLTGLAAWDYLAYCGGDALISVNYWLGRERLNTGYQLKQREMVDFKDCARAARNLFENDCPENLQAFYDLQAGSERRVGFVAGNNPYLDDMPFLYPSDVGTGLSQIVPVIVAAFHPRPCFNSIAQPDLHLHPQLQAELGDLFIQSVNRTESSRFLLETHSEHLILRILRRIRETHTGKAPKDSEIRTDELAIYFVSQKDGVTNIKRIDADVRGEFIQPWPDDFFELDFYERFDIDRPSRPGAK